MPYSSNQELPKGVKENLPSEAQSTWRKIFNSAYDQYHADDKAAATAWAGLKRAGWKQDKEGNWSKAAKKADEAELLKMFLPITKVDELTRTIYLTAASETLDKAGEILDYERSKPNFQKWSSDMYARSGGKSYGNIREMHTSIAAGKIQDPISYDDIQKRVDIAVKIIDDNTWRKVDEGVLTGASIGGKYVERSYSAKDNAYKYVADISEISLVDNPCNPDAVFQLVKADGTVEMKKFKNALDIKSEKGDNDMEKVKIDEKGGEHMTEGVHKAVHETHKAVHKTEEVHSSHKCTKADEAHKAVHKAEKTHEAHAVKKTVHEAHKVHTVKKDAVMDRALFNPKDSLEFVKSIPGDLNELAEMLEVQHVTHKADNGDLQKAGKSYSAKTVKALKAMSHGLGQMGAHCDCEACKAMYKEFIGVKKADEGELQKTDEGELQKVHKAETHKAHKAVHKSESAQLKKLTDSDDLVKGLVSQVEELKKAIQKLENMPVNGGPVLNAQAIQKGFAGQSGNPEQYGLNETEAKVKALQSLRDETNDMIMKDAIGRQLAALEMQKAHKQPINFTPR
jgi:cation transport regulator ChaB